jgi:hypothetical protein
MMSKFATLLERKKTIPSASGTLIYKWSYLNSKGELVEEQRDIDAMIQSFADSVNYKEIIENYGMDNEFFGRSNNAIYADVSKYSEMDYSDVNDYIGDLIKELNIALAYKDKEASGASIEQSEAPPKEGAQTNPEVKQEGGEQE